MYVPLLLNISMYINSTNGKFLDWSKLKAFADAKLNLAEKLKFVLGRVEKKHCGKRRKCWLPAFSPFPTMVSKGFFPSVVKGRDCVVKSLFNLPSISN